MDLQEIECENVDRIHVAEGMVQLQALVYTLISIWLPELLK
jgi:hypothetical protein